MEKSIQPNNKTQLTAVIGSFCEISIRPLVYKGHNLKARLSVKSLRRNPCTVVSNRKVENRRVNMSLRANMKVPKYGLFYFASDRTVSIVALKKIEKVIRGNNKSKGSTVKLKYENEVLQAEIIDVNGM